MPQSALDEPSAITFDAKPITKQIDCSEDDGEALLTLLRIAHLGFGNFLDTISLDSLWNLAILCELYDCHRLVSPWSGAWIEKQRAARVPGGDTDERWLYIAWSFGRQDLFYEVASELVKCVSLEIDGGQPLVAGKPIREPMPEQILGIFALLRVVICLIWNLEYILELRVSLINSLLDIPYQQLDRFQQGNKACKRVVGHAECDALIYGSLALQLSRVGLWPKVDAESYTFNAKHLASLLTTIRVDFLPAIAPIDGSPRPIKEHFACRIRNYTSKVTLKMIRISAPVLDCHQTHMDMRSTSDYLRSPKVKRAVKVKGVSPRRRS